MTKRYHVGVSGPAPCEARTAEDCRLNPNPSPLPNEHFNSEEAHHAAMSAEHGELSGARRKKTKLSRNGEPMVESNGVLVVKDQILVGDFLKEVVARSPDGNSRYTGTWEELEALVKDNFHNNEPGTGSVDGDVILVNLPTENFNTTIVEITDENRHLVEHVNMARVEGEAPVMKAFVREAKAEPAKVVKVVLYRADTLDRDDSRTNDAEWEIVAVLSQPSESVPMEPATMERNARRQKGGTYREYTDEQWEQSREFWSNHAHAWPSEWGEKGPNS